MRAAAQRLRAIGDGIRCECGRGAACMPIRSDRRNGGAAQCAGMGHSGIWHSVALCRARSYILSPMKKPHEPQTHSRQATPRLRERKKDATRRALILTANKRFHSKGFEATTIDEICADAGVSRRTFFRYFANKDALAFPNRAERLERFLELLEGAPNDESPLTSLRRIAQMFAREYSANREQLIAQQRLIASTPALIAREHDVDRDWENAMADAFIQRLPKGRDTALRARMLAGAAIGVIRATMRHWFEMDGRVDLGKLGSQALDALQDGFLAPEASTR